MSIVLEHLTKRYDGHPVVNHVSLEVANGEFFVLLGASGSGKSTILRMIAGLAPIDQGRVILHGRDVTHVTPQQRGVGFVFQHYALFRHMSVADNIEFGLKIRKIASAERRRRRDELLELVGLAGLGSRMPRQLSGGQQQRVALARALAYQPDVLLLDEPFGALDAKIRIELRRTMRRIQNEIGMTTIFVTHDQEEAFELADRIGVMNFGRLLEVGQPEELYQRPQTEYVATFLGTANLLVGQTTQDSITLGPLRFPLSTETAPEGANRRVQVLFRPEDVTLAPTAATLTTPSLGEAVVEHSTFSGAYERLRLRLPPIAGVRAIAPSIPFGGDFVLVEATRPQEQAQHFPLQAGSRAWVGVNRIHALTHPGLNFLLLTDGSATAQAALDIGGQIARLAHARTTVIGYRSAEQGSATPETLQTQLQEAKERLGSGLPSLDLRSTNLPPADAVRKESERQPYDMVVLGIKPQADTDLAAQILQTGEHHLLLAPGAQTSLARALICVAAGEPGKEDVRFAARLLRHLGADVTLLSVLSPENDNTQAHSVAERFLERGARTMALFGVTAQTKILVGAVRDLIVQEMTAGNYDMLVLGAPLPGRDGRVALSGVAGDMLRRITNRPILIVRSPYTAMRGASVRVDNRTGIYEEVVR